MFSTKADSTIATWKPLNIGSIASGTAAELTLSGKELIANTSNYLGSKGSVAQISNGMNCQNCRIDAGRRHLGDTFGAVALTYPKYRDRSARKETIAYGINECMEPSMNRGKLDSLVIEIQAMVAYLKWIGKDLPKGKKSQVTGTPEFQFLSRASDTAKGRLIYVIKCQSCHGTMARECRSHI